MWSSRWLGRLVAGDGQQRHVGVQAAADLLEAREIGGIPRVVHRGADAPDDVADDEAPGPVDEAAAAVVAGRHGGDLDISVLERLSRRQLDHAREAQSTHQRAAAWRQHQGGPAGAARAAWVGAGGRGGRGK